MDKQAPVVDWIIAENDADWERLRGPSPAEIPSTTGGRHSLIRYFWGVVALLLLLTTGGHWWWRTLPDRMQQAEVEVTATAQPAVSAVADRDDLVVTSAVSNPSDADWWLQHGREVNGLRAAIQTSYPDGHLDLALDKVDVHRDQAATRVVTYTEHGAPAYRQKRFYRRIGPDWRQTAPDAKLWWPERRLETPSFVFHFRQNDAPAVFAIALQMDALFTTMQRNFGLPDTPGAEKLVIEVSVTHPPGLTAPQPAGNARCIVASPALYLAPVELTDADLLAQSLALLLLDDVIAQASERFALDSTWQPMLSALRLWQMWDLDVPLAIWRKEVVKWVYHDLSLSLAGQPVVLPDHYAELGAAHKLWMPHPQELNIPLGCTKLDWGGWYWAQWGPRAPQIRLDQFFMPEPNVWDVQPFLISHPGQTVALATLVEYAVATSGHERLPALIAGLGQYDSWGTLIPAVFGVSVAEFETGWQAHLAAHYAVSPAAFQPDAPGGQSGENR